MWWLGACDLGWIPDLTFTNCNNRTYFIRLLSRTELIIYVRCLENSAWHITSTNYYYYHHHHCYYDSCYNDDDGDNEGGDDSGVGKW